MASPTAFKTELVRIARGEHELLGSLRRGDQQLEQQIVRYCRETGIPLTPLVKAHYSAAFISWCICSAGASRSEFAPVAGHAQYARRAKVDAERESGLFRARRLEDYPPQVGDIIHVNRDGGAMTYELLHGETPYYPAESGIVVQAREGSACIVMGNCEPAGNVGMPELVLNSDGKLVQRAKDPIICVIEVLK
jgi:hypothetical protein